MKKEEESKSPVCETNATLSERIYRLSSIFHRIWTIIRYRPFFPLSGASLANYPSYANYVVAGQPARLVKRYNPATRKWEREVRSKGKANL